MRPRLLSPLALVLSFVGFGASLASLVDFMSPEPTFCAASGCATVRASAWAHPLGVPMPVLGLGFFAIMIVLAFVERPRLRGVLAVAGGVWAIALIALQAFVIGAWCKLCMIADPIAIAVALAVVAGAGVMRPRWWLVAVAVPAIIALPLGVAVVDDTTTAPPTVSAGAAGAAGARAPAEVPAVVAAAQQPGVTTVVDFIDFECPFCRRLAPKLDAALAEVHESNVPVQVIRKMVPLAQHRHAMTAALAWCCAEAQGKGDEMAAALFAAPPDQLTPEGCEQLAVQVGCDRSRYEQTLADPAIRERIAHDTADAQAAGVQSFPTVFINTTRFAGSDHDTPELVAALQAR